MVTCAFLASDTIEKLSELTQSLYFFSTTLKQLTPGSWTTVKRQIGLSKKKGFFPPILPRKNPSVPLVLPLVK